jgi:hypothetical protein
MRLNIKAVAITLGIVWGGAMLFVLTANWLTGGGGGYGESFITVMASVYPGLTAGGGVSSIIVGTIYGALDGAIGGAIVAWIYNKVLDRTTAAP